MKKILNILLLITIGIFINITKVNAANFTTSISGNSSINANSQFTLTINVSGTDVAGFRANLNYDSNKLTLVSGAGTNGFSLTTGSPLVIDNSVGKSGTFGVATLTFQAKSSFSQGQSTNVAITIIDGSDGSANPISGSGSSKTITVSIPKSSNNNLSNLTLNNKTISNFNTNTTAYTEIVENNITSININGVVGDNKASISGIGTKTLNLYDNIYYVVVTAENGSQKTYSINIVRKDESNRTKAPSSNNKLTSLTIEGYDIVFNPETIEYEITVKSNIDNVKVNAEADATAKVKINNIKKLKEGSNIIEIIVTAENKDIKTYTINVIKEKPTLCETKELKNTNNFNVAWLIVLIETTVIITILIYYFIIKRRKNN